jgi:hypothetical protein
MLTTRYSITPIVPIAHRTQLYIEEQLINHKRNNKKERTNGQDYISNEHKERNCYIIKKIQANNNKKLPYERVPY